MASAPSISATETEAIDSSVHHRRPRFLAGSQIALAACFVAALFVPLVGTFFHWDFVGSTENRVLARMPGFPKHFKEVTHFAELSLDYYSDHFGFRNSLIHSLSLAKYHTGLGLDNHNTGIIIGKSGWLFYPSDAPDPNLLADRNLNPFTPSELDAWVNLLEQRNRFCEEHHIAFIAVIPPDKQTVYPEYLPDAVTRIGKVTRLDQLIARLHETHSRVKLIDLRPTLMEAKKQNRIYFKTDTHWNDYGAYAAYPVIINAVNEVLPWAKIQLQPKSEFIPRSTIWSGDLAHYLNLYYEYNEDWLNLVKLHPFPAIVEAENPYLPVTTQGDPHGPALYMLHDSFTLRLKDFLGPHFSRTRWQWGTMLFGSQVLDFKPDIVIDEFLERVMNNTVPQDPPEVANAKGLPGEGK
jgi:hypothetical protein